MDRNFRDRRNNGRNFKNKRNDGKNIGNGRSNHERNSETNRDNEEHRNVVNELCEQLDEAFVKWVDISKEKLNDDETERSKLVVEFDSIKLIKLVHSIRIWELRAETEVEVPKLGKGVSR